MANEANTNFFFFFAPDERDTPERVVSDRGLYDKSYAGIKKAPTRKYRAGALRLDFKRLSEMGAFSY